LPSDRDPQARRHSRRRALTDFTDGGGKVVRRSRESTGRGLGMLSRCSDDEGKEFLGPRSGLWTRFQEWP
jgi:hypothetical protein